jgi:hypothetical protein
MSVNKNEYLLTFVKNILVSNTNDQKHVRISNKIICVIKFCIKKIDIAKKPIQEQTHKSKLTCASQHWYINFWANFKEQF